MLRKTDARKKERAPLGSEKRRAWGSALSLVRRDQQLSFGEDRDVAKVNSLHFLNRRRGSRFRQHISTQKVRQGADALRAVALAQLLSISNDDFGRSVGTRALYTSCPEGACAIFNLDKRRKKTGHNDCSRRSFVTFADLRSRYCRNCLRRPQACPCPNDLGDRRAGHPGSLPGLW